MSTGRSNGRYRTVHNDPTIGNIFGRWTVIGGTHRAEGNNNRMCLCRCECGAERDVLVPSLYKGLSTGCGCVRRGRRLRPYESTYRLLVRQAELRGYLVEISYEDFVGFTKATECHYCGDGISWCPFNIIKNNSSRHNIDRADNSRGYVLDNCVVCCTRCNTAKQDHFTYHEWLEIGRLIRGWKK